jgi:hypothetical protein
MRSHCCLCVSLYKKKKMLLMTFSTTLVEAVKLTDNEVTSDVKGPSVRAGSTCFITRSDTIKLGRMLIVCLVYL